MLSDDDVNKMDSSEILKVLKDYELEDRNDVVSALMLSAIKDVSDTLALIHFEMREYRKLEQAKIDAGKTEVVNTEAQSQ